MLWESGTKGVGEAAVPRSGDSEPRHSFVAESGADFWDYHGRQKKA